MGQFNCEFAVYGPVTLPNDMAYYGANNDQGSDSNPDGMVADACMLLDSSVDFRQYDRDGDGVIDNVYVFYAGVGENYAGTTKDAIWPHSWFVYSGAGKEYKFDGVLLDRYACSNEWIPTSNGIGRPDGIGTFVHEFSHVLGLPDLYSTNYNEDTFTPGEYSVLDQGPYNNESMTPPTYSVFERYALGWMPLKELNGQMNVVLRPISTNEGAIIRTANPKEFYLFENRQKEGWDAYLPGHGMLVWHIDYNESIWNANTVNDYGNHQYVDLIEADAMRTEGTRAGDPFPGTAGVHNFTAQTNPALTSWTLGAINQPVTDIMEKDGLITFVVCGGDPDGISAKTPEALPAQQVGTDRFTAVWKSVPDAEDYELTVFTQMPDQTYKDNVDFGEMSLPEGWSKYETSYFMGVDYSGVAAPCLNLKYNGSSLTSPAYADGVSAVSFWVHQRNAKDGDLVKVKVFNGSQWVDVKSIPVYGRTSGQNVTVDNMPSGSTQVKIEFARISGSSCQTYIDDVQVNHGMTYKTATVPGYDALSVGDVTSYVVTGLETDKEYYYTVRATDGAFFTKASNQVTVRTGNGAGVEGIVNDAPAMSIRVNDNEISAAEGALISVYDISGRQVATATGSCRVNAPGIYLVRVNGATTARKVLVK